MKSYDCPCHEGGYGTEKDSAYQVIGEDTAASKKFNKRGKWYRVIFKEKTRE